MSIPILIIGESGSGKSTSIESLDPKETYIIQCISKQLPFRAWKKKYSVEKKNLMISDNTQVISQKLTNISERGTHIKTVIIDDLSYTMSNELMRKVNEVGYTKFTQIAKSFFDLVHDVGSLREDLNIIFLAHSETKEDEKTGMKTSGRMLDVQFSIPGMFTVVFETVVDSGRYSFMTQNNGSNCCKSPRGMFESNLIPNDLQFVIESMNSYYNDDEEPNQEQETKTTEEK